MRYDCLPDQAGRVALGSTTPLGKEGQGDQSGTDQQNLTDKYRMRGRRC